MLNVRLANLIDVHLNLSISFDRFEEFVSNILGGIEILRISVMSISIVIDGNDWFSMIFLVYNLCKCRSMKIISNQFLDFYFNLIWVNLVVYLCWEYKMHIMESFDEYRKSLISTNSLNTILFNISPITLFCGGSLQTPFFYRKINLIILIYDIFNFLFIRITNSDKIE